MLSSRKYFILSESKDLITNIFKRWGLALAKPQRILGYIDKSFSIWAAKIDFIPEFFPK